LSRLVVLYSTWSRPSGECPSRPIGTGRDKFNDAGTVIMSAAAVPARVLNPWLIALTVMIATFMEVLDMSIANVALPHIAGDLGASIDDANWVLTSYLVVNAMIIPLSSWLSTALGRKRYYMGCVALFTLTSALCGLATSLPMLIPWRVVQGIAGSGLQPISQAILIDTFLTARRAAGMVVYSVAALTAPVLGPTLGGWITDNYSWRWIFDIECSRFGYTLLYQYPRRLALAVSQRAIGRDPRLPQDRAGLASFRLTESLQPLSTATTNALEITDRFFTQVTGDPARGHLMGLRAIRLVRDQQAYAQAFVDCFWVFTLIALAIIPLTLLMKRSVAEEDVHIGT